MGAAAEVVKQELPAIKGVPYLDLTAFRSLILGRESGLLRNNRSSALP